MPDRRRADTNPRVLLLDHTAQISGGELALWRLLPALRADVQPLVLLGEDGPMVGKFRDLGVPVEILAMNDNLRGLHRSHVRPGGLPLGVAGGALAYVVRLAHRLRQLQPDIVHTNSLKAAIYGGLAGRLAGVPVVWQLRDRIAPDYLPAAAVGMVRTLARVVPRCILAYDATLQSLGGVGPRKFAVVDPVDPRCFAVERPPTATASQPLRIGMVGRIDPWKGQHVFIEAFSQAFPAGEARAVIVGSPLFGKEAYEHELRDLAQQFRVADRVDFLGFREDVPAELAALDVAVHASVIDEPFGQVVTEAMAAGLPIVASDGGGPASMITDSVDGLLTPPGDVHALAKALRRLADEPGLRHRLGQAARNRAAIYRPDQVATAVLDAYRVALDAGQRGGR